MNPGKELNKLRNLKMTPEERIESARKAGIASGVSRRKKAKNKGKKKLSTGTSRQVTNVRS